jgi:DNA-binding MarR family transcriptional regulator
VTVTDPAPDAVDRARRVVRALARVSSLLERSSSELSMAHYRVLSAISSGDERASRIAGRLALGKPAISAAVASLSERGLLVRSDVDGDLRAADLKLTADGEALLRRVEAEMVRRLEHVVSRTPDPGALMGHLEELAPAIEEVVAERARAGARRDGR